MKKLLGLLVLPLLLVGCGESEKTMTCTRTENQDGMNLGFEYIVTYQDETVLRVDSKETIDYADPEVLTLLKEQVEIIYSPYDNLEHYTYEVGIDGNVLTSKASINYELIDTEKLIKIDSNNEQIIKDGKVSISDIEAVYTALGASCTRD